MLVWSRQQIAFAQERFEVRALLGKMSHLTESELRFVVETVATQRHDHDHVMDNDSSHQPIFNYRQAIPHRLHHGLVGLWISYGNSRASALKGRFSFTPMPILKNYDGQPQADHPKCRPEYL